MTEPLARLAGLPGVPDAIEEARAAVDRLLRHRALRRRSGEVSAESALRGARASAALEGVDVPLEDVRAGAADAPVVQGALRASAELGSFLDTWRRAPRQVLARLHVLVATGAVPVDQLGRPRSSLHVDDPLDLGTPPGPEEVAARLDALAGLLTEALAGTRRAEAGAAPAVVVAAIAHGELLALRPFGFGNGLVARAAERLTLVSLGLDPRSVSAPEVGHLELRPSYAGVARGYAVGGQEGVAAWVRHCATAISLGAREATAICEAMLRS